MIKEQAEARMRDIDPARHLALAPDAAERLLARSRRDADTKRAGHRQRLTLTLGLAAVAVVGLTGTAAAAGVLPGPVIEAFAPGHAASWDFKQGAVGEGAVQLVTGPGPNGTTLSVWQAPITGDQEGRCIALVGSVRGAPDYGKPAIESGTCERGNQQVTQAIDSVRVGSWISPIDNREYYRFYGSTNGEVTISLRQGTQPPQLLTVQNGWFVGYIPAGPVRAERVSIIAQNEQGHIVAEIAL